MSESHVKSQGEPEGVLMYTTIPTRLNSARISTIYGNPQNVRYNKRQDHFPIDSTLVDS
jgi:hypothetical protein